jgi:formylmethanofuran dehydrogenase subunit B
MSILGPTFGRGAMTNSWMDIRNTDLVVIMGGNAAEAHPCGFKWVTEAKANRGAKLIVVDPRYTRSATVSDCHAPYWQKCKKFFVSFQPVMWGEVATAQNDFAYQYLPKIDVSAYDVLRTFEMMPG